MKARQTKKWTRAMLRREGNLWCVKGETWAAFRLRPQFVDGMTPNSVEGLIRDFADRVTDRAGTAMWWRITSVPFPCEDLLERLQTPIGSAAPVDVPGAVTRAQIIEDAAWFPVDGVLEVQGDGVVTQRMDSRWPVCVVAVRVAKRELEQCDLLRVVLDEPAPVSRQAVDDVAAAYRELCRSVQRPGWEASPLDNDSMALLYDLGVGLGHSLPEQRPGEPSPLAGALVRAVQDEDGVTVPVRVDRDGDVTVRHNRIMRLADWRERDTDVVPAWISWAMRQPYRVDIAAYFEVKSGEESARTIRSAVKHNEAIRAHMNAHKVPIARRLRHALDRGPELLDDVESGVASKGCLMDGQVVFSVSGATAQEAIDNAKAFKAAAAPGGGDTDGRGPGLTLEAPPAQFPEWRKFIPGEPWALAGHRQRQGPRMLACGLPQATSRAGDSTGAPLGAIGNSSDFYYLDFLGGVRRDKAGLWGVLGDQGCGKSSFLAYAAWWLTLVDLAPTVVLDPSGRIAGQLRVPELASRTRHIRLDLEGAPGTLASHFLIPDPTPSVYDSREEYEAALEAARTTRVEFAIDAAASALPVPSMAADPDVAECLRNAITGVGGEYGIDPSHIIDAIAADGPTGARLAKSIRAYSMLSGGKLLWRDRVPNGDYGAGGGEDLLTIMSVAGVTSPQSDDRSTWTTAEARSVTLLAGAAQLASAHVWKDRSAKGLLFDEMTNLLSGSSAVVALTQRGALDCRKVTCSFGGAMHLSDTLSRVGQYANAMFGAAFLMRTERANAAAALPMLRVEPGHGWEDIAPTLGNGEMIASGWDERVVRTRFDQAWLPSEFRQQLSTSTLENVAPLRTLFGVHA